MNKIAFANGCTGTRMFAGFCNDEQVTAWYRNRQKVFAIMRQRRGKGREHMTIRGQVFISPPKEIETLKAQIPKGEE